MKEVIKTRSYNLSSLTYILVVLIVIVTLPKILVLGKKEINSIQNKSLTDIQLACDRHVLGDVLVSLLAINGKLSYKKYQKHNKDILFIHIERVTQ